MNEEIQNLLDAVERVIQVSIVDNDCVFVGSEAAANLEQAFRVVQDSAKCMDCKLLYEDDGFQDLLIPNAYWNVVVGRKEALLCPNCLINRLYGLGLTNVPFWFASGPLYNSRAPKPEWVLNV